MMIVYIFEMFIKAEFQFQYWAKNVFRMDFSISSLMILSFLINLQLFLQLVQTKLSSSMLESINPQTSFDQIHVSLEEIKAFQRAENIIISLSSKERYIKVFPYSHKSKYIHTQKMSPHILVYEQSDKLTVQDLIYQYAVEQNQEKQHTNMEFIMQGGTKLDPSKTIQQITTILRVENLDGLEVYLESIDDLLYSNECCVQSMIQSELSYNSQAIEVGFFLPGINYPIYIPIDGKQKNDSNKLFQYVRNYLSTEIKRVFGQNINPNMINLIFKQKKNEEIRFGYLTKKDQILVKFTSTVKLPPPPHQNNSCLIIFGQGIKLKVHHYDDIKNNRLKDLLNQIQPRPNWCQFGLKINDFVLKPEEKFSKAHYFMKNSTALCKYFAGQIISQPLMFQAEQKKIRSMSSLNIEQIVVQNQTNLLLRSDCKQQSKLRAQKTSQIHFKQNLKSVQPILLYTSQLQVKPTNKKYPSALFYSLNAYLRANKFRLSTEEMYKHWEYSFTNELLQQLKKIDPITNKILWRGISHSTNHKVGERIFFQQFTSTSTEESSAKQFAESAVFKIIKSHSGKPIKEFSYFQNENQVLFEPYVQFQVKNRSKIAKDKKGQQMLTLYEVEEIKRPAMPDDNALFLLWVDDKTPEGLKMWNSLTNIKKTSVMVPLLSTEELKNWLQKNKLLLQDKTAEFVMITNMTRKQKGIQKQEAGVDSIKLFQSYLPNGKIFVYIGWLQGTLKKLKDNKLVPSTKLLVSNVEAHLRSFLNEVAGLK